MSTDKNPCGLCTRPVHDNAACCWTCTNRLERDLGDVTALLTEVNTTRLRQARTSNTTHHHGVRAGYDQLPDSGPDEALDVLRAATAAATLAVVSYDGGRWPAHTVLAHVQFVQAKLPVLRRIDDAPTLMRDLTDGVSRLRHSVDRQAERIYAGPCLHDLGDGQTCQEHLTTYRGEKTITCRGCKTPHDPKANQEWLLKQAEDQLAPAAVLAGAVTRLGQQVTAKTINNWARFRLTARGLDLDGRPLYRVGDVLDLITDEAARKAREAEQREKRQRTQAAIAELDAKEATA